MLADVPEPSGTFLAISAAIGLLQFRSRWRLPRKFGVV
jgi:hypothetical protein